jgi:hypothetical protein
MQPHVSVYEKEAVTILNVGFENGESVNAFFFTKPDTLEEQAEQDFWKRTQDLFRFCLDDKDTCPGTCETCSLIRAYGLAIIFVGIASVLYLPLGFCLGVLALMILARLTIRWHMRKGVRALKKEQLRLLNPVQKRLYFFADQNDFEGALNYALEISKPSK